MQFLDVIVEPKHPNLHYYQDLHAFWRTRGISHEVACCRGCTALREIIKLHDSLIWLDTPDRPKTPDRDFRRVEVSMACFGIPELDGEPLDVDME